MSPLDPFPPGDFSPDHAAHLLWRAGFGGTWEEAVKLSKLGLNAAVDLLVNFPPAPADSPPECARLPEESDHEFRRRTKSLEIEERNRLRNERRKAERENIAELKFWWLRRMLATHPGDKEFRPLEEKMTLFWHSHFASSYEDKIETSFPMWRQNQTFRKLALSPFPTILESVIRDPAMLVWLDNAQSTRDRPNENFARELMELFTTGVGQYTERDVKESARALTGLGVDREDWSFQFKENRHDEGAKTYLGKTGPWGPDDVVALICKSPATADFIARKLLAYFVTTSPDEDLAQAAATRFRETGYDVHDFLSVLFRSRAFYSERAMATVVKSPVVLAIGALKCIDAGLPAQNVLLDALRLMGQDLFFPPDVNGWPGGATWISSNTLLIRYNFSNYLLHGISPEDFKVFDRRETGSSAGRREFVESQRGPNAVPWHPREQLEKSGNAKRLPTARSIVEYYARRFLQRPIPRELLDQLLLFAETDAAGGKRTFSIRDDNFDERVLGLVHLIMSSPDYQLC